MIEIISRRRSVARTRRRMLDVIRLPPKMLDKCQDSGRRDGLEYSLVVGAPNTPPILATNRLPDLC